MYQLSQSNIYFHLNQSHPGLDLLVLLDFSIICIILHSVFPFFCWSHEPVSMKSVVPSFFVNHNSVCFHQPPFRYLCHMSKIRISMVYFLRYTSSILTCLLLHVWAELFHLQGVHTPVFKTHWIMIHYLSNACYITVRSELKNVGFHKMWLDLCIVMGVVIVFKQLVLFFIQYGSCPCP